jgi:hypothetical protein
MYTNANPFPTVNEIFRVIDSNFPEGLIDFSIVGTCHGMPVFTQPL